jgi:tRNA U34 2-thiouridine synthase MnmA/TrmU
MKLLDYPAGADCAGRRSCCSRRDIEDARAACGKLDMDHMVFNFTRSFWEEVVVPFREDYLAGRTPNPCILCNRRMKFARLRERAGILGFRKIATGHYARIARDGSRLLLLKARDRTKDQSYVLYAMTQEELGAVLFPLGDITKAETRALCSEAGLEVAMKPESQDICFVPDGDYAGFLAAGPAGPEGRWNEGLPGPRGGGGGTGGEGGEEGQGGGDWQGSEEGRGNWEGQGREGKAGDPGAGRDGDRALLGLRGADPAGFGSPAGGYGKPAERGATAGDVGAAAGEAACGLSGPGPFAGLPGPGDILAKDGKVIGRHGGVWRYTVGQRKGLGLPGPEPSYVLRIDPVRNSLTVGGYGDLASASALVGDLNLISVGELQGPMEIGCKIRYRQPETPALLEPLADGRALVTFRTPQTAVAPGQAAVFYDGEIVVGGGTILGTGPL